jgi:hypothetical protein
MNKSVEERLESLEKRQKLLFLQMERIMFDHNMKAEIKAFADQWNNLSSIILLGEKE